MNIKCIVSTVLLIISFSSFATCSSETNDNDLKVLAWAYEAMMASNNYNYANYNSEQASNYYTPSAFDAYKKSYDQSGLADKMKKNKLVLSVGLSNSPLLLGKDGSKWTVQLPLLIHLQSDKINEVEKKTVTLDIIKDDTTQGCLKIKSYQEKDASN